MTSEFSLVEKVALITGGASGIGLAIAKMFLKHDLRGATIVDVDEENGEKSAQELAKEFGANRVLFIKTDVSNGREVEAAFEKVIDTFHNLDIVVNAAGIYHGSEWEKEVAVNLIGTMHSTLLGLDKYLPKYKSADQGVIINVSSIVGLGGIESSPTYCAAKHGIVGLSRSLGTENHYTRTKVRVLIICPGRTETPLYQKLEFLGPPYKELFQKMYGLFSTQSPEKVAEGVMKAIRRGQNGSVWIVNSGKTYEVNLPDLFTFLNN